MEVKHSKYITGFVNHTERKFLNDNVREMEKCAIKSLWYTINHDLLLEKLRAYEFSNNVLILMCSYLKDRKQRAQINNNFSSEKRVITGVSQGSIDGPPLFNLFITDLIFS